MRASNLDRQEVDVACETSDYINQKGDAQAQFRTQ